MTDWQLTPTHAKHLTELLNALRPDWDRPGIADAVWKARHRGTALDVCVGAIKATTPTNRTPAVIPMDGQHWRDLPAKTVKPQVVDAVARCEGCGGLHTRLAPCDPPESERSRGRGAKAAKAALTAARDEAAWLDGVVT